MNIDKPAPSPLSLGAIREAFIERVWLCMCIYGAMAVPLIVWRSIVLGNGVRMAPLIALIMLGLASALVRRKMHPQLRAALPPALLIIGGLAGLASTGLQGNGVSVLIFGCVCASTIYPNRLGAIIVGLCWLGACTIALLYVTNVLRAPFGAEFTSNPMIWAGAILTTVLLTVFVSSAVTGYHNSTRMLLHEVERQRDEIAALANHDALTGLPSLRLARDRIEMACGHAQRNGSKVALLFVDLDDFKNANDNYGHEAGNAVLRAVAQRLQEVLRATDTAARIGGDEFLVVLGGVSEGAAADRAAEKIIEAISYPVEFSGNAIRVGASIGIALYPEHGNSAEALLRQADEAMYRVKKSGKNGYTVYRPD